MIDILFNAGIKLGISSSNSIELVIATLEALNVRHFFKAVHTSCEVKSGKPCPDVYLLSAADLNVSPEKCLVFEDVPMGIMAGKNAGMRVCAIDDEFSRNQEATKRELADFYIKDYNDIIKSTYEVL
jgi:beta-phosphoglucomutase-like phosphatase (HAD superfamily)